MKELLRFVILDYDYAAGGVWAKFYCWFNLLEGIFWFVLGTYVFNRFLRNKKSRLEIIYSLLFFIFGLTDFREVQNLPIWLLILKGVVLSCIIYTRHLLKPYYPRLTI